MPSRKLKSKLKYILVTGCLALVSADPVQASGALDRFFESLGASVNNTSAGSFSDQASGYYTGGGYGGRIIPSFNPSISAFPTLEWAVTAWTCIGERFPL